MHKFKVGQRVMLSAAHVERGAASLYRVVARLPEDRGVLQYRIESADRLRLRVAQESQLSAAGEL